MIVIYNICTIDALINTINLLSSLDKFFKSIHVSNYEGAVTPLVTLLKHIRHRNYQL